MPYSEGLEVLQWAREATPGSDLATTSKLIVTEFNPTPVSELYRPEVKRGLMQRYRGFETPVKRWTRFTASGPVSYEQLQNWLCGAIINVASPTGSGPYVWTFTRNPAVYPSPCTFTIERYEYDGTTAIQHAWHYCVVEKFTINFADGQPLTWTAEGFARRIQTETLTASIAIPTPEIPPTALASVFIDTSFAGIGGTQVQSQVLSARVEIMTGAKPQWTLDARADLDFTTVIYDSTQIGCNLNIVALLGGQYATEKAAAEAGTLRAVQLKIAGSSSRELKINGVFKHEIPELFEFGEQNGQKIVEMNLVETSDGTNLLQAVLTNNISALV